MMNELIQNQLYVLQTPISIPKEDLLKMWATTLFCGNHYFKKNKKKQEALILW